MKLSDTAQGGGVGVTKTEWGLHMRFALTYDNPVKHW